MEAPLRGTPPGPVRRRDARDLAPPPGSVPGALSRQPFSYRAPRAFFVDASRKCLGCGARFVLTGREQRRWTETLGLRLDRRASRCPSCRREWLRRHGAASALADAARALSEAPEHAPAVLAYARAAVAVAERLGEGPLDAALLALSRLPGRGPGGAEALYWRGRCFAAAGRPRQATREWKRALSASPPAPTALLRDARRRIGATGR